MLSRRRFITAGAASALGALVTPSLGAGAASVSEQLVASPSMTPLYDGAPSVPVFSYNSRVPGPVLRYSLGDRARIELVNRLDRPTTLHWHGLRVPNAMDGVPDLTQPPVAPGARFNYQFKLRNAGTYWYHPHFQSAEQLDRGLAGPIVVTGEDEPVVDRDLIWVLDDWRMDERGQPAEDYGHWHDWTHAGRLGNTVTVNGRRAAALQVKPNERIRLRLVNAANARIFNLDFTGHRATVIALDGHAVTPHVSDSARVVIAPSMRVDVIIDCTAGSGQFDVNDVAYRRSAYTLTRMVYGPTPLRSSPLAPPRALPPPALPVPDLVNATQHVLTMEGGAMGRMRAARLRGQTLGVRELVNEGKAWAFNGIVAHAHKMPPMFRFSHGTSHIIELRNDTAFAHPVHLHGHPMLVLGGVPGSAPLPHWRDTVLVAPRSSARVACVADNPGLWMIHCHIPEHQEAGMMGIIEVA